MFLFEYTDVSNLLVRKSGLSGWLTEFSLKSRRAGIAFPLLNTLMSSTFLCFFLFLEI